ncbi:MFS transporter [Corynebacterium marinum]|uniref:Multidrug resistance protein n=1 Tax=Corynebacterium marinum DSM 44953 TaxID=1224162 RepID=A0A0B6TUX6_9CORY|nr:MFS transporter [Corynebacterium marinum]AJK68551.1 multidrug resistance protein [Corynebacterium marinum DSM 44953]GGO14738.1 MFS transporter [Corynebacterium marinum]
MTDQQKVQPKIPTEIWVLVAAAFIIALGYGLVAPIIPQFAVSFDVSMAAASAVISIFAASRLLFAPVSGRLIDRLGSRKVYLTGLLTVAVATALVAGAQEYWHILLLRGIAGIGSTMFTVSAMGLIVRMAPPAIRGRASAVYGTAFLVGNIIGPLVGAALSMIGMRAPFVIYGVSVALAAFVVWWKMPRIDEAARNKNDEPPMGFSEAIRDSAYRSALVSGFAFGWINFGVRVATLPLFAAVVFEHGGAIAGLAMAAFAAGNAVVLQFSGRLADSVGRKPLVISGLVVNAIFTGSMGFADSFWPLLIVSALAGAGAGMVNPAQQAVLADVIGNHRSGGKVLANFQMAQDFGAITGPILIGAVAETYGFTVGFLICGFIGLAAAVVWAFGRETLPDARGVSVEVVAK